MNKKFYITTAIPYVNAQPHIGFALEIVQADVLARYHRLRGEDTYFLTGTDENALKNVQAAEKAGVPVGQFVDNNSRRFYKLKQTLNLSFDDFIRTTEERHIRGAQALWSACRKQDIYKKKYKGWYCVGCEAFYTPKDIVDSKCPEHKTSLDLVEEENYFFRLSAYQKWLENLIVSGRLKIIPEFRKNEVLAFIRQGLEDFSISRSRERARSWGIPVPGDPSQIIYVWFDALANYITALGWQTNSRLFKKYWPADVHIIGKGITRFHAIYWPAMLKSAGLAIPKQEFIHGYVTVNGEKISKSLGNIVDPFATVKKYGTDPVRYYLLREIPSFGDGDFSESRFVELYNADLANGLGNLFARVTTLAEKYFGGKIPKNVKNPNIKPLSILMKKEVETWKKYEKALESFRLDGALQAVWEFIDVCDDYIAEKKPWELAKNKDKNLDQIVYDLFECLHQIAWWTLPFIPETAQEIAARIGAKKILKKQPNFKDSWDPIMPGAPVVVGKPLFPRLK